MNVLVPVRYPLSDVNERAIQRGLDLMEGRRDAELLIFHLNEIQGNHQIDRKTLKQSVEAIYGEIGANYVVRDGFLVEEAIIELAIEFEMDLIVLSRHRRDRWQQILRDVLDEDDGPEKLLREHTGIEIEVVEVTDSEGGS